jgi:hypothetical protein
MAWPKIGGTAAKVWEKAKDQVKSDADLAKKVVTGKASPIDVRDNLAGTISRSPGVGPILDDYLTPITNPKGNGEFDRRMRDIAAKQAAEKAALPDPSAMASKAASDYRFAGPKFNPYQQAAGPQMQGMNFDPYRQVATNQAQSSAHEGLTRAAGLSGADRMKAFSDFNRAKIMGTLQGGQKFDQAQGQNLMDVNRFNASRGFDVNRMNTGALNDAAQVNAKFALNRDKNLYEAALGEKNLQRRLDAAKIIGNAQMAQTSKPWYDFGQSDW